MLQFLAEFKEKYPAGQILHILDPSSAYLPAMHFKHLLAPSGEYFPGEHKKQDLLKTPLLDKSIS